MAKRIIDYPSDSRRIARRIEQEFGDTISDKSSFSDAFIQYMGVDGDPLINKRGFERETFEEFASMRKRAGKKSVQKDIIKDAGGTDLRKDRAKTAETVVKDERTYRQLGASKADLEGYDTRREFIEAGIIRGKVVRVRKTMFKIKGKSVSRLRDSLGRFAKRR